MKIIFVIPNLGRGGAERVASLLTDHWIGLGHQVKLVIFENVHNSYLVNSPVENLNLPTGNSTLRQAINILKRAAVLLKVIIREKPDKIIAFTESASFPVILACMVAGKCNALTISVRTNPLKITNLQVLLMRLLYWLPKEVVVNSKGAKNALVQMKIANPDRIRVIYNPIDFEKINFALRSFSRSPEDEYIVSVGRLSSEKGHSVLLRAFAIANLPSHIKLKIVGSGPDETELHALASELGIQDRVEWLGSLDDPYPVMVQSSFFVLPSHFEGWPNALNEAMACGCAIISTKCDFGPPELVEHGKNGFLVAVNDCREMGSTLSLLCADKDLQKSFRMSAALAAKAFDIGKVHSQWLN